MIRILIAHIVCLLVFCVCFEASAQSGPVPGQVTTVSCKHDSSQTYACYVPTKYKKSKKWPILYCFAPDGNGMAFVRLFKDVCERQGWIVVGSNNAKNGPGGPIIAATKAMWQDTRERLSVDEKRCYSSGFSGGSGMAFDMAQAYPDNWAGVIPMAVATSWAETTPPIKKHIAVYFIIGDKDAVQYVKKHAETLKAQGNQVEVKTFPGGHTMPPKNVAEGAVDWMVKVAPRAGSSGGGGSSKPTELSLKDGLAKRLQLAVRKAAKGYLGSALGLAQKVLDDAEADEAEKKDAAYVKEEIEKRFKELLAQADALLKDKKPYEARELLQETSKAFGSGEQGAKAKEKIAAIESDESLKGELAAGKVFVRGVEYESKGKKTLAEKMFKQVVEKHPDTEYAKRAKEKLGS